MEKLLIRNRSRSRNNLFIGLTIITLVTGFNIASNCAAYYATIIGLRILKDPIPIQSDADSKKKDFQEAQGSIVIYTAIEATLLFTATGCLWELKRLDHFRDLTHSNSEAIH